VNVAIVSYFAPPQPAVASHRVLRMTRALLDAGHGVHWVTLDPKGIDKTDATLAAVTPTAVVVHGLGRINLVDREAKGLWEKILRTAIFKLPDWFAVLDRHVEWSWTLQRKLPRLVKEQKIDVVLLCCGPHGQLAAVDALRKHCPNVRIIVDYRDLLSGNTWRQSKSTRLRDRVRARERRILSKVDALFLNNADAKRSFDERMGSIDGLDVQVMRNTADYALGEEIVALSGPPDFGPGVHLGFFGTIFPKRRMLPVLQAMAEVPAGVLAKITAHVFCDSGPSLALLKEDLAKIRPDVAGRVRAHDLLGYGDALRAMRAMDVLLLVNSPEPADQIFVPGKLYDYLMARRPVLFLGEMGDAWRIVAETSGEDWCFTHAQSSAVAQQLVRVATARPPALSESPAHRPATSFAPLLEFLRR
jgi:hypothetical protein